MEYTFSGRWANLTNYEFDRADDTAFSLKVTAIDELFDNFGETTFNSDFDLDDDGDVDISDRDDFILNLLGTFFGDANLDGTVDVADLNALGLNWQEDDILSWSQGDFNDDEFVGVIDLNLLALNWQKTNGNP